MINFDKIKIITLIDFISGIKESKFISLIKNGELLSLKYTQNEPCSLLININYKEKELVLEFTGKILSDEYYKLINKETITNCLNEINKLEICKLDVVGILKNSTVVKCDVTKDIKSDLEIKQISDEIKCHISNYSKWKVSRYNKGVCIDKLVKTPKYKRRLTIYDKYSELMKATNKAFINNLHDKEMLLKKFTGIIRFELNINCIAQIKELLGIKSNDLESVLSTNVNPIRTVLNEIIISDADRHRVNTWKSYTQELVLRDCNYDLELLEAKIRGLISTNTPVKRVLQPYKDLYQRLMDTNNKHIDVLALVI